MATKRWTAAKKESDIALEGITIDAEQNEFGTFTKVILTDEKGHSVHFSSSYGMETKVPAPPKLVDKYKVEGVIAGVKVLGYFDSSWDANSRRDELNGRLESSETQFTSELVKVEEE